VQPGFLRYDPLVREAEMLQAAVIGLGWWGKTIVRTLEDSSKLRVVRAVDRDVAAADWAAQRGLRASTDIADALSDPQVAAVILCTPHTLHTAQIAQAAAARKHVFCEKPLALRRCRAIDPAVQCRWRGAGGRP
jgi:predicted dehydrogenase